MADINELNGVNGVFGGVELGNIGSEGTNGNNVIGNTSVGTNGNYGTPVTTAANAKNLPVKAGFWTKFKNFWLQDIAWNYEIKVELTPYQQKVEDEINEFLHQEITWEKVHDFLFQEVTITK
ncbi:MAG: hypothetical protein IKF38_07730 [Clostridia bacterium]|nr:hypothetical protein [Clostridia bacterium]